MSPLLAGPFQGAWDAAVPYVVGNIVLDRAAIWQAVTGSTNSRPDMLNANWALVGGTPVGLVKYDFSPAEAITPTLAGLVVRIGHDFDPNAMAALTTLSLPVLTTVGNAFTPRTMASLTTLSAPALTTVGGDFYSYNMAALTTLSIPALTTVGGNFAPNTMASLTTLSLPALTIIGGYFNPYSMDSLTTLSVPALTTVGDYFNPNDMASLTTLSFPALLSLGGDATITDLPLDLTSVNALLVRLAALDGTAGTTTYDSHMVDIKGPLPAPTGAGITAVATLRARSNTVTVNYRITAVNTGSKTFTVTDVANQLGGGAGSITIAGSTGNDGTYTIVSAVNGAGVTVITVVEAIPDATADGWMVAP